MSATVFPEIASHARKVPSRVARVVASCALRRVRHQGLWAGGHGSSAAPKTRTNIYILVIEKKGLVEAPYCGEVGTPKQHAHPRNPISRETFSAKCGLISTIVVADRFAHERRESRETPYAVRCVPL